MQYRSSMIAVAALPGLLSLAACKNADIKLPENPIERAATCYAAAITEISGADAALTPEQANHMAQFVYLGIVTDGIAEQSKLEAVMQKAEALRPGIEKAGNAAAYKPACARAYPSTVAGSFKGLPADDRATRMTCLALSTAAMQMYQSSHVAPPVATANMNARLDIQLRGEFNAEANINPAEVAGLAMRSMAKAVEMGPMGEVLAACSARYK